VYNEELMLKAVDSGADAMTLNFPDKLKNFNDGNYETEVGEGRCPNHQRPVSCLF
jgi:hypothetical protein